jgi:hypothetical protein
VAGAGLAGAALCRLAGAAALDLMDRPWLAPTSAEFWRRWNRPAQQFFYEDVFKPSGGWRAPVRGTLATFAASAAVHEYVFGIAIGVVGYQTAFFLLNGCAAAATLRARPTGLYRVAGVALTLAFVLGTAVLFFRRVDAVLPFYERRPSGPSPLRRRADRRAPSGFGGNDAATEPAREPAQDGGRWATVGPVEPAHTHPAARQRVMAPAA